MLFQAGLQNNAGFFFAVIAVLVLLCIALVIWAMVFWVLMIIDCAKRKGLSDGERVAWVRLPNGNGPHRLKGWALTEHEDGTITTAPSILAHEHPTIEGDDDHHVVYPEWHGYLERGVWREV